MKNNKITFTFKWFVEIQYCMNKKSENVNTQNKILYFVTNKKLILLPIYSNYIIYKMELIYNFLSSINTDIFTWTKY